MAFWVDAQTIVYRHRATGMLIPFDLRGAGINRQQRKDIDLDGAKAAKLTEPARQALRFLSEEFDLSR